jgi:hypothetical protein
MKKSVFIINLLHVLLHFFSQTEKKLELFNNQIGDKGAQQLADAIRKNTVNQILSLPISFTFIFSHVDAHTTRSLKKSHRESRGSTSSWGFPTKQGESYSLLLSLVYIFNCTHRHWSQSTSVAIISETLVFNFSLMLSPITKSTTLFSSLLF